MDPNHTSDAGIPHHVVRDEVGSSRFGSQSHSTEYAHPQTEMSKQDLHEQSLGVGAAASGPYGGKIGAEPLARAGEPLR
jgi:hypothetical protein